jgi:hypothetical protein
MTLLGEYIKKAFEEQTNNVPLMSDMNMMAGPLWASYRQAREYGIRCEKGCSDRFVKDYMRRNLCTSQCKQQMLKRQLTAIRSLVSKCGTDQGCRAKLTKMAEDLVKKIRQMDVRVRYYQQRVRQAKIVATPAPTGIPGATPGAAGVPGAAGE